MNWFTGILNFVTVLLKNKINNENQSADNDFESSDKTSGGNGSSVSDTKQSLTDFDESRILQDYSVTQKWHNGWKRSLNQITEVVIHHTDGTGNIDTLKRWMLTGERKEQYIMGISLFHFAIGRDGKIWKAGPLSRWWYHSCSGKNDRFTIGIENIHKSGSFTDEQYENLFWMLFEYIPHFCPSYNRIVSHDYNYNTYCNIKKGCPGPDFDWGKLENEMARRNIAFETHGFEEYTLTFPI